MKKPQASLPSLLSQVIFKSTWELALLSQESLTVWVIGPLGSHGITSLDIWTTKWFSASEECPQTLYPKSSHTIHLCLHLASFWSLFPQGTDTIRSEWYFLSWVGSWLFCRKRLGEAQFTRALLCPGRHFLEHFLPGTTFTFLPIAKSRLLSHGHVKLPYRIISSIITGHCHVYLFFTLSCYLGA